MKKRKLIITTTLSITMLASVAAVKPAIPRDEKIESKVESTLKKMTLDEKIGQMCELNIDVIIDKEQSQKQKRVVLDKAKMEKVFGKYKVGSILNVPLSRAQTKEVWQEVIKEIQDQSKKNIGIPDIYGVDQIHGTTYTAGGTLFPQEINQGASFNRDIAKRVAEICAYESKAASIPWVYSPVMDLGRNPVWPRLWESWGEDCYVNSEMAVAAVLGFQGNDPNNIGKDNVGACIKHYMAYGVPVSGQDRTPSLVSERELRERYFKPFMNAAKAGALSLMVNSAVNDGIPFHANKELITKWIKEDLNWDGMIVTDWADIDNLYKRDHIAKDKKEAICLAINAGIDMSMDPYNVNFCDLLKELVNEGKVKMDRIDDAVRRILRLKYRLNLFDKPYYNAKDYKSFGSKEFASEALTMAEEGEVLLKNEGAILPLKKGAKILVAGPNANSMRTLNGGWSYTWLGDGVEDYAQEYNTIFEALCNKYGKENVVLEEGVKYNHKGKWDEELAPEIGKAVLAAKDADVIVACVGENTYAETPGNCNDITLSENQRNLIKSLSKTGKPIILVLNEGRPRIMQEIEPLCPAIINVMLPGNYGGDALANLISGDSNFSAKLPFTYPSKINSFSTYDYKPCQNVATMEGAYNYDAKLDVQWPFAYGLSYTTFKYSNFTVDKSNFTKDDILTFSIDVTNTGALEGKEPVLLFSSDVVASVSPDNMRLRNFQKIDLKPGETKQVKIQIKGSDLAFVGLENKWILEEGEFRIKVGDQILMLNCNQTYQWDTPNIE